MLSKLFSKIRFASFPSAVESNVGYRQLVDCDSFGNVPDILSLHLMSHSDFKKINILAHENFSWLKPWSVDFPNGFSLSRFSSSLGILSTRNDSGGVPVYSFREYVSICMEKMRNDEAYFFKICLDGEICGFISISEIFRGCLCSGIIGYWISKDYAGRSIMPTALAMLCDFAFDFLRLHRLEINICSDNTASLRVVEKLSLRCEGLRKKYIYVNGHWSDHYCFALSVEDICCGGILRRFEKGCTCV